MTYEAEGFLSVKGTHTNHTLLSLGWRPWLASMRLLDSDGVTADGLIDQVQQRDMEPLLVRVLSAGGFVPVLHEEGVRANGVISDYLRFPLSAWRSPAEAVVRVVAKAGFLIEGEFFGEDKASWLWRAKDGALREFQQVRILDSRLKELHEIERRMREIEALLSSAEAHSSEGAHLAAAISAVLSGTGERDETV